MMEHWLFGYGSLMWDPGFPVAERVIGTLRGFHRSFCLRSTHYRGTPEAPGLVLGLDESGGASCEGAALRVAPADWDATIAYVRGREMITNAYREIEVPVRLLDGRDITAITYVMRPGHPQYAVGLTLREQARIIARARGGKGPNRDYLFNTLAHLDAEGLEDPEMAELASLVRAESDSAPQG